MFSHILGLQQKVGPGGGTGDGSVVDPYFENVRALLHCDDGSGIVAVHDEIGAYSWTTGNESTTHKFGSGSLYNAGPGSALPYATANDGVGSVYTFEFWAKFISYWNESSNACLSIYKISGTSLRLTLSANGSGTKYWRLDGNGFGGNGSVSVSGEWQYVALCADGTNTYLFIDGALAYTIASVTDFAAYTDIRIHCGGSGISPLGYATVYFDEFRYTRNICRYTPSSPPTVPIAPFPSSGALASPAAICLPRGSLTTTFSVVAVASVFGIVGTALGTITLATVSSSDAALTAIVLDEYGNVAAIPGLTFSYAAGVLSVSGTPTGHSHIYSIAVCYRSSDGTYRSVGSSLHDITIANAADVLTIGSMVNPSIRQGQYSSTTILSPTTNFAVGLLAVPRIAVPGMDVVLSWTIGSSSGSGSVQFSGTPTVAGSYTLAIDYYTSDGTVLLGTSTHTVAVSASYVTPPPPPAPSPGPAPPAPSPPPAPTPAPQPGHGPDPYLSSVKALLHFDDASNIAKDQISSNTWTNAQTLYVSGAVGGAGGFASSSKLSCTIAGVEGLSGLLTVELMFDIDSVAWNALTADGTDFRWCPISYLVAQDGSVLWALGLFSYYSSYSKIRRTRAGFYMPLLSLPGELTVVQPFGPIIPARPNKFMHLAGAIKPRPGGGGFDHVGSVWLNGDPGLGRSLFLASRRVTKTGLLVVIGGSGGSIPAYYGGQSSIVNFSGKIDEYRLTAEARYASYMDVVTYAIPEVERTIPWSNS